MNHTPEPWQVRRQNNGGKTIYSTPEAGSFPVIHCIGDNLPGLRWGGGSDVRYNPERIVACVNACAGINPEAVPELLEACKALAEDLELCLARLGCCGHGDGKDRKGDADTYGAQQALDTAKAVIAKAELK